MKDTFSEEVQKAFIAEMKEINSQNPSEICENEDAELVVEEYFSDNEKIKSDSDEDDNVEQEHTLKVSISPINKVFWYIDTNLF